MIIQFVQFESSLSKDEAMAVAQERAPQFRAIPSLIQKFYLQSRTPNHYGGFYVWESAEAMTKFRESDLARSIPSVYGVVGAPRIDIYDMMFPLRDKALLVPERETA